MGLYVQDEIRDQLCRAIVDGTYRPGGALPSTRELARLFRASKVTVQKVINRMNRDGLVESRPGKGVYVRARRQAGQRLRPVGFLGLYDLAQTRAGEEYPYGVVKGLEAAWSGTSLELHDLGLARRGTVALDEEIRRHGCHALVLVELNNLHLLAELQRRRLPMVSVEHDASDLGIASFLFDNLLGAFQATRRLQELGHRRILCVNTVHPRMIGSQSVPDSADRDRQEGYRVAMAAASLDTDFLLLYRRPDLMRVQLAEVFRRPTPPTAVLSCHHFLTRDLLGVLRQLGVGVPEQLSLIGFDSGDEEFAPGQRLATVELDPVALGQRAGRALLQQVEEPDQVVPGRDVLPVRIVDHDSLHPCQEPLP